MDALPLFNGGNGFCIDGATEEGTAAIVRLLQPAMSREKIT
jgi:hypothetical protein